MANSPIDYENRNDEHKKQSRAGIISSVIFFIQMGIFIPEVFFGEVLIRGTRNGAAFLLILLILGLILGIISMFQRKRLRIFRFIGFFGNIGVLVYIIVSLIYALSLGGL